MAAAVSTSVAQAGPDVPARRRFSRTLAPARWAEYERLLSEALARGYWVTTLERFVATPPNPGRRVLVLRHDVDQHPRSALAMAAIETAAGVRSTWYFRWRTADPRVIARLRAGGFEIGLHYETLTRRLLEDEGRCRDAGRSGGAGRRGGSGGAAVDAALISACATELRAEIAAFSARFGPLRSVCPHGDTRVGGIHNGVLAQAAGLGRDGLPYDANRVMRGRELASWVTDRSAPNGSWRDGLNPHALLSAGATPILCVTHPNNWSGGPGLALDRLVAALAPARLGPVPIRTRADRPPSGDD